MSTVVYIARVEGDEASRYTASFPDLPDVVVVAADLASLLREARERLLVALRRLEAEGVDWPEPTPMERLRNEGDNGRALLMLIDVQVDDPPIRVNISLGERLLKRLDEVAQAQSMSRSGFIAAAVRERMDQRGETRAGPGEGTSQRLYDEVAAVGRRINDTLGPESPFGRTVAQMDALALEGLRKLAGGLVSAVDRRPDKPERPASAKPSPDPR